MKRLTKTLLVMALAATAATTTGCFRRVQIENVAGVQTPSLSVPANGATSMKAEIDMGAGELTVSGSALGSDALRGDFTFAPSNLKPEVIDSRNGDVLFATVRQPDASKVPPLSLTGPLDIVNKWDIELSDALPTELVLNMGAGESTVDLSDVDVTELTVNLGAGDAKVDLSGERERDVRGLVQAGAGAIEIRLPKTCPYEWPDVRTAWAIGTTAASSRMAMLW